MSLGSSLRRFSTIGSICRWVRAYSSGTAAGIRTCGNEYNDGRSLCMLLHMQAGALASFSPLDFLIIAIKTGWSTRTSPDRKLCLA